MFKSVLKLALSLSILVITYSPVEANNSNKKAVKRIASLMASEIKLREDITNYAHVFLGIPYVWGGKTPQSGFDCSGFTAYVMQTFGLTMSPSSHRQAELGAYIPLEEVIPGDLLFYGRRGNVSHVSLILNRTGEGINVIHATCSKGIMVENVTQSRYWAPRILFARNVLPTLLSQNPLALLSYNYVQASVTPTSTPTPVATPTPTAPPPPVIREPTPVYTMPVPKPEQPKVEPKPTPKQEIKLTPKQEVKPTPKKETTPPTTTPGGNFVKKEVKPTASAKTDIPNTVYDEYGFPTLNY